MSRLTVYGGGSASPLAMKGDIYGHSTVDTRIPVGADGQALIADSTQAVGMGYATMARYSDWVAGLDLTPGNGPLVAGAVSNINLAANTLYLVPVDVPFNVVATRLEFFVATAAAPTGSTARLGVFTAVIGGFSPYLFTGVTVTRVLDAGTVAIDTTGLKTATISLALAPGRYWLGVAAGAVTSGQFSGYLAQRGFGQPPGNIGTNNAWARGQAFLGIPNADVLGGFAVSYGGGGTAGANEYYINLGLGR